MAPSHLPLRVKMTPEAHPILRLKMTPEAIDDSPASKRKRKDESLITPPLSSPFSLNFSTPPAIDIPLIAMDEDSPSKRKRDEETESDNGASDQMFHAIPGFLKWRRGF